MDRQGWLFMINTDVSGLCSKLWRSQYIQTFKVENVYGLSIIILDGYIFLNNLASFLVSFPRLMRGIYCMINVMKRLMGSWKLKRKMKYLGFHSCMCKLKVKRLLRQSWNIWEIWIHWNFHMNGMIKYNANEEEFDVCFNFLCLRLFYALCLRYPS